MEISALRGAICVPEDRPESIVASMGKLWECLLGENQLSEEDIAFVLITQTGDLKSKNPAGALRSLGYCPTTPLFCMQELEITGMLEKVIRVMLVLKKEPKHPHPVYLDGAEKLRPDLLLKTT